MSTDRDLGYDIYDVIPQDEALADVADVDNGSYDAVGADAAIGDVPSSLIESGGVELGTDGVVINADTSADAFVPDLDKYEITHNLAFTVTDKDTVAWGSGTIYVGDNAGTTYAISAGNTGNMAARTYIFMDIAVSTTVLQTTTTVSGTVGPNRKLIAVAQNGVAEPQFTVYGGIGGIKLPATGTSISNNNWFFSGTWSVTDADTVAWGSGTLTTSNGGSYAITAGNTGNMSSKTYIYFDLAVSSTVLQTTTTAANCVGDGKILIAVAQNGTGEASYQVMNDFQKNIVAGQIVAGSITANEIATGTITASLITVSTLSAIVADLGAITAGTITLNSSGYIKGGQTAYDTGTGFFLGYSGSAYKFSIGVGGGTDQNIRWDGTKLIINGYENTGIGGSGGTGADGALTVATGTTTTLTAGRLYQYSSVDIQGTGKLKFTGNGIAMILCSGNFTMSSTCEIDTRFASTAKVGNVVGVHALGGGSGRINDPLNAGGTYVGGYLTGGAGGAGGSGTGSSDGAGGAGGAAGSAGTAGNDGLTGTTGGGGGGGGGSTSNAGSAGSAASGKNGGAGGAGGSIGTWGGTGGSGGAGTDTGNGGAGGDGGTGTSAGGHGGNGGDSGSAGGNGGNGGNGQSGERNGGRGGNGYVNGGNGGNGGPGDSTTGHGSGNGGAGGTGRTGTGGTGGAGGDGISSSASEGTPGTGGAGGNGATGGTGGVGGTATSSSHYGRGGGAGGDALNGTVPLFVFVSGNLTVGGTIRANGGNGGNGGTGGGANSTTQSSGSGGSGGDASDGADVYMLCKGTYTDNGVTVNNAGGLGGSGGAPGTQSSTGPIGSTGASGRDGTGGRTIMGKVTL